MEFLMKRLIIVLMVVGMVGCAVSPFGRVSSGGASYTYQHSKGDESCMVQVTSARDVAGGTLEIYDNCTVKTSASTAGGSAEAVRVIGELVGRLP